MSTPQITVYDCVTGEIITRDFNETELTQFEADKAQHKKDAAAQTKTNQALADKRQTILDRLGITNDEFKTLIN